MLYIQAYHPHIRRGVSAEVLETAKLLRDMNTCYILGDNFRF